MKQKITILLLGFVQFIIAQHTIIGTITDNNSEVLSAVEIYAPELHKGTTSDFDGYFTLKNLPNKSIKLVVSYLGFKTKSININKDTKTLNIVLEASETHLDEIVISTPFNKLQSQNVMKVESINLKDETNSALNLTEKLSKITGITTIGTGNGIGKPVIRGLSGNRVLVYNQGLKYENFQSGEKHGLGINEHGISSVEIIKGPASLLYGSDALGGVIYLIPEKFEDKNKTSEDVSSVFQSNSLGINSSVGVKTSNNKLKFLARGSFNTQSDYKTSENIIVTNSRFNNKDFKTGFGFDTAKTYTDIRYNYNQAFNGIVHTIGVQNRSKEIRGLYQELKNHVLSLKNHAFFNTLTLKTNIGYTSHNRNLFKNNSKKIDMLLNTFNYDIKVLLLNTGKLETITGVQGMYQTNSNRGSVVFLPNANVFDFGFFINSNYELHKSTLQAGIRFDSRNIKTEEYVNEIESQYFKALRKKLNNVSGAIGLKTALTKNFDYRINLALGFRSPNLSELTANGFHEGRYELGNNDLKNEKNFQIDVNFEYDNKVIAVELNGFFNKINDYIYLSPSSEIRNGYDVYIYNQNNSQLYGGELDFHYHPVRYKWIHFKTSGEFVVGENNNGNYLPRIPGATIKSDIKINFTINDTFKHNFFNVNNKNVFNQTKISQHETKGESYTLFNLGLGTSFSIGKTKSNLSINVYNLFNQNYIDHLSVLKEDNIPNPGRNVSIGMNLKF